MKKILAIIIVACFAMGLIFGITITDELKDMANQLVQTKAGTNKPSYAFVAFTTDYKNTLVDNYITDALMEAMFNTGKVKIIERSNLENILTEQKFQSSGLVNEETVKSIGMIAGVDFVCYGTLKDLNYGFTINARVVDVETGELCAIARATVTKDDYLKKQPQTAAGTPSIATTKTTTATTQKTTASTTNNAWEVTSSRKEFDGYTEYIFTSKGTDNHRCVVIYQKNDRKYSSRVIVGLFISDGFNDAEIKVDDGSIIKIHSKGNYSYDENGMHVRLDTEYKDRTGSGRNWLKIFMDNEHIVTRAKDIITHFETAGLLDKMAEYGITWEEIDAALANEEF